MKKIFALISATLIVSASYGQKPSKSEKKLYKKAGKQLTNEAFKDAQQSYSKLLEMDVSNEVYHFEGGLSYYLSNFERGKSIPFFEGALKNSTEDTIPELYYYLGRAYHINGDYEKSKDAFTKFKPFIETSSKAGQELMKKADYFIKINERANNFLADKNENIVITNLGDKINTSYGEYAPVLKNNDNILLFTSRRPSSSSKKLDKDLLPYENVYIAKLENESWTVITDENEIKKYMPNNLNSKKHDAGVIYSSDGKTLYTYKNDLIWKSVLEDGAWSKLIELDENINTSKFNIPSVSISKDGNTLYFVSNRKKGLGGKDIYISKKTSEGNWGEAVLMSESINTVLDEDSPFISDDGKTLYFSSKGHQGIGGYDIYKSEFIDGKWAPAENMGIPINSPSDDIYFIIDNENKNGFTASARDGGIGGMDIYSICMHCPKSIANTINGVIASLNDSPINNAEISIKTVEDNHLIGTFKANNGEFSTVTDKAGEQELSIVAPNYEKQITHITLPNETSQTDVKIILSQFDKSNETYQVLNLTSTQLGLNQSDTIKIEKAIASSDNTTNNNGKPAPIMETYLELFSYNSNKLNINNQKYLTFIDKAVASSSKGKVTIDIESSASKVPTSTFGSNNKLAASRGEKAKELILKSLKAKGANIDNIIIHKVNAIVSGPNYNGDHQNTEKYSAYQYVKISVK